MDPVDEDTTESSRNTLNELFTTLNPTDTVTDKEPPVTSDGILLPSEFVSLTDGMHLSSSVSTNFTDASLTQVVDSSSTASLIPSVSGIDPKLQSAQVVPTDDITNENYLINPTLMTTSVTLESQSDVTTETSSDQLSSSPSQTPLYDKTTLYTTFDTYSSIEREMTSSQYDMSTTDMVSSPDLTTSLPYTDDEKINVISHSTASTKEITTSTDSEYSHISDYSSLKPSALGKTKITEDIITTQSSDYTTADTTSVIMSSSADDSFVEISSFVPSTLSSTLGTDQTTGTISTDQFSSEITSSETSRFTSEIGTAGYTESTYSSPHTTPELSTEQGDSEAGGTTETTSPSASFTDSNTLFSPDYELTVSVPNSNLQTFVSLDVTTELITSGSTVSEDMNAEPTIAANFPASTAASASVDSGGVLGNDHMTSPNDQDTSTPGVGPSVTGRCNCYAFCNCA